MDIITAGETMVAFIPHGKEFLRYSKSFEMVSAGTESNVAVDAAKLGLSCGWISKLGKDEFGEFLLRELRGEGVDTSRVIRTAEYPTGIMFKQFTPNSESSVFYYRKGSAASTLSPQDIDPEYIRAAKILHLTGVTPALSASCAETVAHMIKLAVEMNIPVSFDPNIRLKLWSREKARETLYPLLQYCNIIETGLDEAELLLGVSGVDEVIAALRALGVGTIAVKLGAKGAVVAEGVSRWDIPPVKVEVLDNIGAGDAFDAGFLCGIIEGRSIEAAGKMGALMGALAVSSYGDVEGLPNREQFDRIMNRTEQIYR